MPNEDQGLQCYILFYWCIFNFFLSLNSVLKELLIIVILTGILFWKKLKYNYNFNNPSIAHKITFYDPIDIGNRPWIKYYLFNNTDITIKKMLSFKLMKS